MRNFATSGAGAQAPTAARSTLLGEMRGEQYSADVTAVKGSRARR
jgi:hypothetical protein